MRVERQLRADAWVTDVTKRDSDQFDSANRTERDKTPAILGSLLQWLGSLTALAAMKLGLCRVYTLKMFSNFPSAMTSGIHERDPILL